MWLAKPIFLHQEPSRRVQLAVLLTLLWTALPLLWSLPAGVFSLFALLWLLRLLLWLLNIKPLSWLWLALLLIAAVAAVWQQLGSIIGREGGVAFLLLLTLLKSYEGHRQRDWQVLLLAMLVVMGGAVLFNQNIVMALWLLGGLWLFSVCMAMLGGLHLREAWRQSILALTLALPLAAVLFVALPRLAEPLWHIPQPGKTQALTGLSDTLRPGSISDLVQSNEPAFNVVFADDNTLQQRDLYWRVMVMADFDGRQWRAAGEQYVDDARVLPENSARTLDYQLIIRDEHGRIPALDYPLLADTRVLSLHLGAVVRVNRSREGLRRVVLQSALTPYLGQALNDGERAYYTRLPGQTNPQTHDLAHRLRRSSADDRTLINNTLAYFHDQGFVYTLQPLRNNGANSTDFFLFQARQGFCEDYAHAFVYLMRAAGVPARIVTGYQGGEYNPQGQFWQVRSKDAHAWAEVWLAAENTWLRVDPTTAVAAARASEGVGAALPQNERSAFVPQNGWLYQWGQNSRFYWQQWVVNFDANRQQNLFQRLGLGRVNARSVIILLLLGGLAAALPLLWWWHWQQRRGRDPLADGFYLLNTHFVDDRIEYPATLGPLELQQWLQQHDRLPETVKILIDDYIRHRYAHQTPPPLRVQWRWYRRVKRALRRHKP